MADEVTIPTAIAISLYQATVYAIGAVEEAKKRKSAERYMPALSIELASYRTAQAVLAKLVPGLATK